MAGDFALQEFTKVIQRRLRSFDLLGRYGGEEFIIVMINCVKEDALKRVETILEEIRETTFEYNGNQINFTFTAGIANSNDFDFNNIALDKLLDTADKRLYKGKELGRNRIISINEIN
jgi:diguanylate cyclase (GGDEF)-like protein